MDKLRKNISKNTIPKIHLLGKYIKKSKKKIHLKFSDKVKDKLPQVFSSVDGFYNLHFNISWLFIYSQSKFVFISNQLGHINFFIKPIQVTFFIKCFIQ